MRLTEALIYCNMETEPSDAWRNRHFHHFEPTESDREARKQYRKRLEAKDVKKLKLKDMFED